MSIAEEKPLNDSPKIVYHSRIEPRISSAPPARHR
jgi:hypothetical protein